VTALLVLAVPLAVVIGAGVGFASNLVRTRRRPRPRYLN